MDRYVEQVDAQHALHQMVEETHMSREIADREPDGWIAVGSMQKSAGKWVYSFKAPTNITMYSERLDIRRQPTSQELDEIKEQAWG